MKDKLTKCSLSRAYESSNEVSLIQENVSHKVQQTLSFLTLFLVHLLTQKNPLYDLQRSKEQHIGIPKELHIGSTKNKYLTSIEPSPDFVTFLLEQGMCCTLDAPLFNPYLSLLLLHANGMWPLLHLHPRPHQWVIWFLHQHH